MANTIDFSLFEYTTVTMACVDVCQTGELAELMSRDFLANRSDDALSRIVLLT